MVFGSQNYDYNHRIVLCRMDCYNCGAETSSDCCVCEYCDEMESIEMEIEQESVV